MDNPTESLDKEITHLIADLEMLRRDVLTNAKERLTPFGPYFPEW